MEMRPLGQPDLVRDIAEAIRGQYEAVVCYQRLVEQAPTQAEKERIREIRRDEQKHLRAFTDIYRRLTGQRPRVSRPTCPPTYRRGLEAAIQDELKTVDFYLEIADRAQDPAIKKAFFDAALDEQNHAGWFTYFLLQAVTPGR